MNATFPSQRLACEDEKEVPPKKGFFDYIFVVSLDIAYTKHTHTLLYGQDQL